MIRLLVDKLMKWTVAGVALFAFLGVSSVFNPPPPPERLCGVSLVTACETVIYR